MILYLAQSSLAVSRLDQLERTPTLSPNSIRPQRFLDASYHLQEIQHRVTLKHHCHFFFNKSSAVVLHDTSWMKSTQVKYIRLNNDSRYRLWGDPRQRVLHMKHQVVMWMDQAQFRITWRVPNELIARQIMYAQKQSSYQMAVLLSKRKSSYSA